MWVAAHVKMRRISTANHLVLNQCLADPLQRHKARWRRRHRLTLSSLSGTSPAPPLPRTGCRPRDFGHGTAAPQRCRNLVTGHSGSSTSISAMRRISTTRRLPPHILQRLSATSNMGASRLVCLSGTSQRFGVVVIGSAAKWLSRQSRGRISKQTQLRSSEKSFRITQLLICALPKSDLCFRA